MVVLYHGTSSHFAKDIIANGLGTSKSDNQYAEIRYILSKYLTPSLLTDEFFDSYSKYIDSGTYSSINIRQNQGYEGNGPFGALYSSYNDARYHSAASYAKSTTSWGAGEFEHGIVKFLNSVPKKLADIENNPDSSCPPEYKEFLELIINNAQAQYITPDKKLKFHTSGNEEKDFPILIQFEVPDEAIALNRYDDDIRTKEIVRPENITGIAFLPTFRYESPHDFYTPELKFFSKEEFLEELNKRQGKRHWCEPFEIKNRKSQETRFLYTFPTSNLACVQEYLKGSIDRSIFYARHNHINKGKIAEKTYQNEQPQECEFYDNGELTTRVIYRDGKPKHIISFDGKKLTKKQLFILEHEAATPHPSVEAQIKRLNKRKEEIRARQNKAKDSLSGVITADNIADKIIKNKLLQKQKLSY